MYLSEHPFARAAEELRAYLTCGIIELTAEMSGRDVIIGGVVQESRLRSTKDGRTFLSADIEDHTGSVEVTVWPETYEGTKELWELGNIVVCSARVKDRDDRLSISVNRVVLYGDEAFDPSALIVEQPPGGGNGGGYRRNPEPRTGRDNGSNTEARQPPKTNGASFLRIVLEETDDAEGDHERLRALVNTLRDYGGEIGVRLSIRQRDGEEVEMELPSARQCPELTAQLSQIIGPWGIVGA